MAHGTFDIEAGHTFTLGVGLTDNTNTADFAPGWDGKTLTKTGGGTLILSGNKEYTGDTYINAGTLLVNGALSRSGVFVKTGGTLGGNGTISNGITFEDGSTYRVALNGPEPIASDVLTVSGGVITIGDAVLDIQVAVAPMLTNVKYYVIINDGATFAGTQFTIGGVFEDFPEQLSQGGGEYAAVVLASLAECVGAFADA